MRFREALDLVAKSRKLICCIFLSLVIMSVIGYLAPSYLEEVVQESLDSLLEGVEDKTAVEVTIFIIANNLRSSFMSVLLGITFLPLFSLIFNGYFIGAILHFAVAEEGIFVTWKLLPHGIFEIPAICISLAFGLRIGLVWFRKDRIANFKKTYKEAFIVLVHIVLPLLIVAGLIEGTLYWMLS